MRALLAGRQRRPPLPVLIAGVAVTLLLLTYLHLVPRDDWVGLYPSPLAPTDAVPALEHTPPELQALLDTISRDFARIWTRHSDHDVPKPVYLGHSLTTAQRERYAHLRRPTPPKAATPAPGGDKVVPKYMFTTVTREIGAQLPDLLNALAVVTGFLGAEHVSLSILEGPSGDPTAHVLNDQLRPLLLSLGVDARAIHIETDADKIDFDSVNRIEALAGLRNRALAPLWEDGDKGYLARTPPHKRRIVGGADVVAVVYFNDVFLHAADILEVLHQHVTAGKSSRLGTGVTAAWDWMERDPAYFYDVWVSRTIDTGDLFYPIDQAWWSPSDSILSTSPASRTAYDELRPFQAYSAWNALAVLNPTPFQAPTSVRFRRSSVKKHECAASECTLLASDFWKYGYGRVQVVPSVQLAYGRGVAVQTALALQKERKRLGWRAGVPPKKLDTVVEWVNEPPAKVRCNPWPEVNGLSANVWEKTEWVKPYVL